MEASKMTSSTTKSRGRIVTLTLFAVIGVGLSTAALTQNFEPISTTPQDNNAMSAAAMNDTVRDPRIAVSQTSAAPSVKCRKAEVIPITNYAHCIDPIGASLDAPDKPCQRMHSTAAWTMTNGCRGAAGSSAN
jgi:hypothetical protein